LVTIAKPRQIKPWPDLTGLLPLLKSSDISAGRPSQRFHIDLSFVRRVDAIGLAIFLARLTQSISASSDATVTLPRADLPAQKLGELEFEAILKTLALQTEEYRDLFTLKRESTKFRSVMLTHLPNNERAALEKILCIIPDKNLSRTTQISNIKTKIKDFFRLDHGRNFAHEQVMSILLELVKNTLDHSGRPAILAMKMNVNRGDDARFSFVYCDTGEGICSSVRKHLEPNKEKNQKETQSELHRQSEKSRLAEKGGFPDLVHWALQPGNSTKGGNGVNFGLGLMLIVEASHSAGFRLSVRDADTVVELTELVQMRAEGELSHYTHSLIRQLCVKTCSSPILMFHGELY